MCDVEFILGLPYIFPLLECVHTLIKIVQGKDVFVCDFVESVKQAQQKLYKLYCDPYTRFNDQTFDDFNAIETLTNDALPMNCFSKLNSLEDAMYLAFSFVRHKYPLYQHKLFNVQNFQLVTKEVFKLDKVKQQCEGVVNSLIKKLK
jgi:type VI protein secretion system component VasK